MFGKRVDEWCGEKAAHACVFSGEIFSISYILFCVSSSLG